jgi:cytochrome c nitrite reductase small subunit
VDTPRSDTEPPPFTDSADVAPRRRRAWIVGVVAVVLVVGLAIPVALTLTPKQCSSCHEMKPYYDSWKASSHRGVARNCLTCHAEPGVLGVLGYELGFYGEILGHLSGTEVTTTEANAPAVKSCRRAECHSLNREVSNSGDVKIGHRLHVVDQNIACPTCHHGAVHEGVGGRTKIPPVKVCKQCHADKMADCRYCHTEQKSSAPPGTH